MAQVLNRVGNITALRPNWSRDVKVDYQFKTGITTSYDGTEERDALRQTARLTLDYSVVLTQAGIQRHMGDLAADQSALFVVPAQWRTTDLAAGAAAGQPVLSVTSVPFWLETGARLIVSDGTTEEAAEVAGVSGTDVTLTANLVTAFPSGAKVYGAFSARLPDRVSFRAETSNVWTGNARFEVDPASDPQAAPAATPALFEGRELFLDRPNWRDTPGIDFNQERQTLDHKIGRTVVASPWADHRLLIKFGYLGITAAKTEDLIGLFLRMKGRRGSFWAPTWQQDLVPQITTTGTGLQIAGLDVKAAYENSKVYSVLMARWPDGTYQVNRVAAWALSGDLQNTVLTMTDLWSQDVTPNTVLSWVPRWRFAVDTLSVRWRTTEVAEMELPLQTLPNEAP